jgi:hypothetical protein
VLGVVGYEDGSAVLERNILLGIFGANVQASATGTEVTQPFILPVAAIAAKVGQSENDGGGVARSSRSSGT